jgi:5-methylcytosine-specific restriction enzyme subunit McrC
VGERLWRAYKDKVEVGFPSPKTENQWKLTSQGWVGYIPVTADFGLELRPKVELSNVFRMLEYAYRLNSFQFLDDLVHYQSLEEFYEYLANILAKRVLDRARKGFYKAYLPQHERLPYVRGRLDTRRLMHKPWSTRITCHYEEHTPDIEENQILAWTLRQIARSQLCSERVQPTVRRAYRALQGFTSLHAFSPQDCVGRLYNRLNNDYHPMHALCRFFLEHSGPRQEIGDRTMLPFLVNMARLFELFVAEWLKAHLPASLLLTVQEKVDVGDKNALRFDIDLVLTDAETGETYFVLDTKYKAKNKPEQSDISQVVTYAEIKHCQHAVLIYPEPLKEPLDQWFGNIHVQSMTFALDGDLEAAGLAFQNHLLHQIEILREIY